MDHDKRCCCNKPDAYSRDTCNVSYSGFLGFGKQQQRKHYELYTKRSNINRNNAHHNNYSSCNRYTIVYKYS